MDHEVGGWHLAADDRFSALFSLFGICGGKVGNGIRLFPEFVGLSCRHNSTLLFVLIGHLGVNYLSFCRRSSETQSQSCDISSNN
jgi:hypothetical protein